MEPKKKKNHTQVENHMQETTDRISQVAEKGNGGINERRSELLWYAD